MAMIGGDIMIIYRPHRGGLAESLAEAQTFNTVEEMKQYIVKHWVTAFDVAPFSIDDLVIDFDKPGVNDARCGWKDARHICTKRMFDKIYEVPQCIGMCATQFEG